MYFREEENHLRTINTYGACARGGGRRPGYEAAKQGCVVRY